MRQAVPSPVSFSARCSRIWALWDLENVYKTRDSPLFLQSAEGQAADSQTHAVQTGEMLIVVNDGNAVLTELHVALAGGGPALGREPKGLERIFTRTSTVETAVR